MTVTVGEVVRSACPTCGAEAERQAYDIGSGPELACANCEWCWGANGQDLKPPKISRASYLTIQAMHVGGADVFTALEAVASTAIEHPDWDMDEERTWVEWRSSK